MSKSRTFCFTNHSVDGCEYRLSENLRYIAWALETCPSTGKQHHQGWVYFDIQRTGGVRSLKKIADLICPGTHVEMMRGSLLENDAYCSKEGTLNELGIRPVQGDRNDLKDVIKSLYDGVRTVEDVCLTDPIYYHMYGRTLHKAEDILARKKFRTTMTQGIWLWGPTGVGKSHRAFEGFQPDTHYVKCLQDEWWDGYTGQATVILNDFRGQISYGELLTLVDKWPHSVKRRNREPAPFTTQTVIVTSHAPPDELFCHLAATDSMRQIRRRFTIVEIAQE